MPDAQDSRDVWRARWAAGGGAFTAAEHGRLLAAHWPRLGVAPGARVLVPMCGKSPDMVWLAQQGFAVTGVEISPIACEAFFAERGIAADREACGPFVRWQGGGVSLLQGDVFDLQARYPAALDRGGLVALAPEEQGRYAAHLGARLTPGGVLLLVTMEYDPARRAGPPFSVTPGEVRKLFPGAVERARRRLRKPRWEAVGGAEAVVWEVRAASAM